MPQVQSNPGPKWRKLQWWRVAVWLWLLFAAIGCRLYSQHASAVWTHLHGWPAVNPGYAGVLRQMLAWDVAYLLIAIIAVVLGAAALLRRGWSRVPLRWLAVLLALGVLLTCGMWLVATLTGLPAQAPLSVVWSRLLPGSTALGLRAIAVLGLFWLAWQLGRPAVRLQFRSGPRDA